MAGDCAGPRIQLPVALRGQPGEALRGCVQPCDETRDVRPSVTMAPETRGARTATSSVIASTEPRRHSFGTSSVLPRARQQVRRAPQLSHDSRRGKVRLRGPAEGPPDREVLQSLGRAEVAVRVQPPWRPTVVSGAVVIGGLTSGASPTSSAFEPPTCFAAAAQLISRGLVTSSGPTGQLRRAGDGRGGGGADEPRAIAARETQWWRVSKADDGDQRFISEASDSQGCPNGLWWIRTSTTWTAT